MSIFSRLSTTPLVKTRKIILFVILTTFIFSVGYYMGKSGLALNGNKYPNVTISREVPANKNLDFSLFWKVWDTVSASYYDKSKIIPAKMVYGAISGMVSSLEDPYTVFLTPEENKLTQEDLSGSFEGVGIQIGFKGTQLAVIAPLPGSPAEAAGIKAGDYIIGIKDEAKDIEMGTVGISLAEAVKNIRGKTGTKVTLTLLREGENEPIVVDIERARLDVPTLTVDYVGEGDKIVHIKLLKFGAETTSDWDKTAKELSKRKDIQGIILDLRNNPGGYLQASVDIASDFLPNGSVVVIEERSEKVKSEFKVQKIGLLLNRPVVVLVNEGSASASEILAGALRDIEGIRLIGAKTFGKGTIQEPQEVENGAGLHITIAKWLTPKGTWVNDVGLTPDIEVEDKEDTEEDEQLNEAVNQFSK